MPYTTLAAVKLLLGITGTGSDALVQTFVDAANPERDGRIGRCSGPSADTSGVLDGRDAVMNGKRLYVSGGVRTAPAMTIGSDNSSTQTAVATTDWALGCASWELKPGQPYGYVE